MKVTYHHDEKALKAQIRTILLSSGISVDAKGQLSFVGEGKRILANAVYLLRHAETAGTQAHKFMSNDSENSHVCEKGREDIVRLNQNIEKYHFDAIIVCCDIPRVLETATEFRKLHPNHNYFYKKEFYGINNGGWEGKSPDDLFGIDLADYTEREINKNIFAKSSSGGSWGEVLMNCDQLIDYINCSFKRQRLLLISQGSILQGLKLLTHTSAFPWEGYNPMKLYNFDPKHEPHKNYGQIECLYDEMPLDDFKK